MSRNLWDTIVVVLIALTSVLASAEVKKQEEDKNLIGNGGFEDDFERWSKIKRDIKERRFKVSIDDRISHFGSKSATIEYLSGPELGYAWFDYQGPIPFKKGASYRLSAYVKLLNVTHGPFLHLHWPGRIRFYEYKIPTKGTSGWKRYDFYFIAPKETLSSLALGLLGKGQVWFDDIQIVEAPIPKDLLIKNDMVFTYKPRYEKEDSPLTDITPEEIERGYITYVRANPRDTYHNSIPKREEITKKLMITATPGEYEPGWFSLYALKELKDVRIKVLDDLKSKEGRIPKEKIDLRIVKCWPQRTGWAATTYYIIPELLEKKEKVDIPKGNTQSFWLTIKVPEEARPGDYSAKILVETKTGEKTILGLNLRVLPFKLKSPKNRYWVMWTSDCGYDKMRKEEIRRELFDMKEHGINSILFYPPGFKDCNFSKEEDRVIFSSPKLSQIQEVRKELKMKGPLLLYWGGYLERMAGKLIGIKAVPDNTVPSQVNDPSYRETVKEAFKAVDRFVKETVGEEYGEWYYLGMDEPGSHPKRQARAFLEYSLAKEAGIKSLITINEGKFAEKILPYVTGMCYHGRNSEEISRDRKERKSEYWWYGSGVYTGQEGGLMPNRYLCGPLFYKSGAMGQVSFVYTRLGVTGDPYNDFDGNNYSEPKDAFIAYPSPDGPVPTLQWEGIREGIDDYKYIYTLQELIEEAKNSDKKNIKGLAIKTEIKLEMLLNSIPWNNEYKKTKFDNAKANEIRKSIISLTMELLKVLK